MIDIKRASEEVHAVLANSMADRKTALLSMVGDGSGDQQQDTPDQEHLFLKGD